MTTAVQHTATPSLSARAPFEPEQRVLLRAVGWEGYELLLRMVEGGSRHVRITYDSGDAELMSPSRDHGRFKSFFGRFVETLTGELNLTCESAGSTTCRRALSEEGFEPDECFFLSDTFDVSGKQYSLESFPSPDLAVEIELSQPSLDRMGLYAAFGVPEVWRFDGEALVVERLTKAGVYEQVEFSVAFPFLKSGDVARWVALGHAMRMTPWARQLAAWVRQEFARHAHPEDTE